MTGVGVVRGQTTILRDVAWSVASDERWVVLGPNGSGKTNAPSHRWPLHPPLPGEV
jgi:iron complex transport system ATP-binding protein